MIAGEYETLRRQTLKVNITTPELELLLDDSLSMKQWVNEVKRMSSYPMGHFFLLFSWKDCIMDYEYDVYCQHCLKEDHILYEAYQQMQDNVVLCE